MKTARMIAQAHTWIAADTSQGSIWHRDHAESFYTLWHLPAISTTFRGGSWLHAVGKQRLWCHVPHLQLILSLNRRSGCYLPTVIPSNAKLWLHYPKVLKPFFQVGFRFYLLASGLFHLTPPTVCGAMFVFSPASQVFPLLGTSRLSHVFKAL